MRYVLATILALLVLAGCGGGDEADSSTDVDQLLQETFSGDKQIDSGRLDLKLAIEAQGGDVEGPVNLSLSGPFQSQDEGRLPLFDVDASFQGAGQSVEAGVTSTGDRGFVSFQGTDYEVSQPVFDQFRTGFEQAQQQGGQEGQSLATLGIDPRNWLTGARNAGEADVGGTQTIKITGGVDVPALLDDVNRALERARSLGLQGSEDLPEQLTDEQKQQAADAVRDPRVEIYTGAEDKILRRMVIAFGIDAPAGAGAGGAETADVRLDLSLLELNEDQEIQAPENARPFEELLGGLGDLGLGGGLGGGGAAPGGGGGTSQEQLEEYTQCIQEAGDDNAAARECADLLTTP